MNYLLVSRPICPACPACPTWDRLYSEKGVTNWRTPNQVELALIYLVNGGHLGLATDGTGTANYFGDIAKCFSATLAFPTYRDGTTLPDPYSNIPGEKYFRVNQIESSTHLRENNWNAVSRTRYVKDRHPTDFTP